MDPQDSLQINFTLGAKEGKLTTIVSLVAKLSGLNLKKNGNLLQLNN